MFTTRQVWFIEAKDNVARGYRPGVVLNDETRINTDKQGIEPQAPLIHDNIEQDNSDTEHRTNIKSKEPMPPQAEVPDQ